MFTSDYPLSFEECYCEQCGDSDWEIGYFETPQEFLKYYANHIGLDDDELYDGFEL